MSDARHGKPLGSKDTVLILFGLSSMFGILNFRMIVGEPNITLLGGLMTLLFVVIWLYFAFSSGWNKTKGFLVAVGILWGVSLIYLLWNYATNGQPVPKGSDSVAQFFGILAFVMLLFATATVIPLYQGLGNLGFLMNTQGRLLLVCVCAIVVLLGVYAWGYSLSKRRPAWVQNLIGLRKKQSK